VRRCLFFTIGRLFMRRNPGGAVQPPCCRLGARRRSPAQLPRLALDSSWAARRAFADRLRPPGDTPCVIRTSLPSA
jgi:hypothetical protein